MSYTLNQLHRTLMENLVKQIVGESNAGSRLEYVKELYKTLELYKILIPFCMRLRVKVGEG